MEPASAVPLLDIVRALAFVGDLAMGQPTDHSLRTAWMAGQLATASGGDGAACADATAVALLRWSGCTANAPEFAQWFGDDVAGRESLLALPTPGGLRAGTADVGAAFLSLSRIHCEVSGSIAGLLGLDTATQAALRDLFESYDGSGAPDGLQGDAVPRAVYLVSVAGDLEIFSRLHGLERARALIAQRSNALYPRELADVAVAQGAAWLQALEDDPLLDGACALDAVFGDRRTSLELLATVIDLKLPWMTGHSRRVAQMARDAAVRLGLDRAGQYRVYRAGLIHGIGRASVPNMVWDTPGPLQTSGWERVRLVPYWTARAGRQLGSLAAEAEIASYAYERLDGSGYYRELRAQGVPIEGRILAAAAALAALRGPRPWREAFTADEADALLRDEAAAGRFDRDVVEALVGSGIGRAARAPPAPSAPGSLTARERDVLRLISGGASNKVAAQQLSISPSTVRTHVESVFRKLGCTTRAAATLKAAQLGWL